MEGGAGRVYLWEADGAIPTGPISSSVRRVRSAGSRFRPSLGTLSHCAAVWTRGWCGGPGCGEQLSVLALGSSKSIPVHACTHSLKRVFLEEPHYRQISRKISWFFLFKADTFLIMVRILRIALLRKFTSLLIRLWETKLNNYCLLSFQTYFRCTQYFRGEGFGRVGDWGLILVKPLE